MSCNVRIWPLPVWRPPRLGSNPTNTAYAFVHLVPDENVMGPVNGGVGVLMSGLDYERIVLASMQIGIIQACLDVVIPYVPERKQFGRPIGAFQLMQAKVADMYVALQSARASMKFVAC